MRLKVSFCTTCMGRLHHLELTYLQNIEWAMSYGNVEFVLVDFNSPDGLGEWAREVLSPYVRLGVVTYCKTRRPQVFEMARAKNVAALVASGDIVCNLDADNFIGKGFTEHIANLAKPRTVVHASWNEGGVFGRVAMMRDDFVELGGYDERFVGYGHEDVDLINRAVAAGFVARRFDRKYSMCLAHSMAERRRYIAEPVSQTSRRHQRLSNVAIRSGVLIANQGKGWGSEEVVRNFSESVFVGEPA